jgi:hypothetical protein
VCAMSANEALTVSAVMNFYRNFLADLIYS